MTENWDKIKEIQKYYINKEGIVNSIYMLQHQHKATFMLYNPHSQPSSTVHQILGFMSVCVCVHSHGKSKYDSKLASRKDEKLAVVHTKDEH